MVAPLLCGTLAGVIPGVGVLTAALLHRLWWLGGQLESEQLLVDEPLHWKLEPPFILLGLVILLDLAQRLLCRFKVRCYRVATHLCRACHFDVYDREPGSYLIPVKIRGDSLCRALYVADGMVWILRQIPAKAQAPIHSRHVHSSACGDGSASSSCHIPFV